MNQQTLIVCDGFKTVQSWRGNYLNVRAVYAPVLNIETRTYTCRTIIIRGNLSSNSTLKWFQTAAAAERWRAHTHVHHFVCVREYKCVLYRVCVCICAGLSSEHKTPPHALFVPPPPLPWQLSHDAPAPGFLPLMAVSVCHLGKPDIPSRGRGPGVNGSHWWAKKGSFVAPGAGVGTRLLTHSFPSAHTGPAAQNWVPTAEIERQEQQSAPLPGKWQREMGRTEGGRGGLVRTREGGWKRQRGELAERGIAKRKG